MKSILFVPACCILVCACLSASAVQVVSNVHYFSREVALPSLAEDLCNVEDLATQRRYADAATALQLVFNSDNPDARQELDAANASAGPLAFQMEVACALYRGLATHWGDPSEAEAVKGLLDLYHDKTGAATWPGTARLYGMLLSETSYKYTLSAADAQALYEEWLTRDPRNAEALKNYVNWAMSAAALADYAQVLAKIDAFESSGGRMTPALELTRLKFRKVSQPYESVLDDALTWLQAHPAEPVRLVTDALTLARGELDAAHPDQVRRYYANLTGLALKQPSSDDRVPLTALILNEKRKLEAVMPEIKPE